MCPILTDDGLYVFVVDSPKRNDLHRDPRYALHAFPTDDNEDAFYVTGVAEPKSDPALRARIADQYLAQERGMAEEPPGLRRRAAVRAPRQHLPHDEDDRSRRLEPAALRVEGVIARRLRVLALGVVMALLVGGVQLVG